MFSDLYKCRILRCQEKNIFLCEPLYFLLWYAVFQYVMDRYDVSGITVLPFIGFFGIAIGSILNLIAK